MSSFNNYVPIVLSYSYTLINATVNKEFPSRFGEEISKDKTWNSHIFKDTFDHDFCPSG